MKYIYLLISMIIPLQTHASALVYGWSSATPPREVHVSWKGISNSYFTVSNPGCTIYAFIVFRDKQDRLLTAEYRLVDGPYTCWGSSLPGDNADSKVPWEWERLLGQWSEKVWTLPYIATRTWAWGLPDTCTFVASAIGYHYTVQSDAGNNTVHGEPCTVNGRLPPEPVSCYVHAPDAIEHNTANVGLIQRRAIGAINVSCTADSRVLLSVQNSELQLESKGQTIRTALYLEQDGQTSAFVDPTPNGTIKLISVIDAQADTPGTYQGSKVIIADLP